MRPLLVLSEKQVEEVGALGRAKRLEGWGKEGSLVMSQLFEVIKGELSELKGELAITL